ncbi:ATP-binding protein [Hydrogenovibrio thermophilus]|uniref:histidine kinase n=1 Tax=Hydrogenovibrio thermophilus TaxID=265883 RepID=A0A410H294_9GAMM|nr:ATP-binding protein [Hydrogenovibrio thermophilus]QAB15041.1 response regulator [Hydrogenovibrio thermophilus]
MNTLIQKLWNQSIRNQLILGTAGILTLLISVFSYFTIHNHSDFLHKEAMAETQDRSLMLAVNSQVWVMANDYVGLEEVISNFEIYKDLIYAAVINMDGKVIAHTDKERIGQYVSDKARVNYLKHLLAQKHQLSDRATIISQNEHHIDLARPIRHNNHYIGWVELRTDQTQRQESISATIRNSLLFTFGALLIGLLVSFLTAKSLTDPLYRLIDTMKRIRKGDKDAMADENGVAEVGQLSHEFNLMLGTLKQNEEELQRTQKNLRQDIRQRVKVEKEIRDLNDNLETIVQDRTKALEEEKEKAEASNRAKSAFLANMSHELRTPLNAILGFSTLMTQSSDIPETEKDNLKIINHSGEHLLQLVNDVLDMSKIEAGHVRLDAEDFDLGELIRNITDMMRIRASEKGLQLLVDQTSKFPRIIHGDAPKLRQILINLLSNAIKFTNQGGITLRLDTLEDDDCNLVLKFEVEDSGTGIEQKDIERIFMPFEQLANATSQKGTGLGLAITRQFVNMMGGDIHVQSKPDEGSIFSFSIQVKHATTDLDLITNGGSDGKAVISLADGEPEWRILVVEDQLENQLLIQKILKQIGFQVKIAENGAKGIELFQTWQPHFIWMDRRMPVMDGLTATRKIRHLPGGDQVKIVALTASVFKDQRDEVMEAGSDDFVRKPYRPEELYDCMARHLPLHYRYAEDGELEDEGSKLLNLSTQDMAQLSETLRDSLYGAAVIGDAQSITEIIQTLPEAQIALASGLRKLVDAYRFDLIMELTKTETKTDT